MSSESVETCHAQSVAINADPHTIPQLSPTWTSACRNDPAHRRDWRRTLCSLVPKPARTKGWKQGAVGGGDDAYEVTDWLGCAWRSTSGRARSNMLYVRLANVARLADAQTAVTDMTRRRSNKERSSR